MTASNQTYMRLVGWSRQPSSGIGMPQSMSRVIARGRRSSIRLRENLMTLGRQVPDASRPRRYSPSASASAGRSRKKCWVSTNVRRLAVDLAARVDQVGRVELVAAVVALVAARVGVPADRAGALDVAVGQGAPGGGADRALRGPLDHVAVAVDGREHLLDDAVVVAGRRPGEEVVGQAEVDEVLHDHGVVLVREVLGAHPGDVGGDQDRRAVLVGAGDHEDVVAGHPHVPAEDVGGHAETGHVADVARTVGVRPGDGGQDMTHAGSLVRRRQPVSGGAEPVRPAQTARPANAAIRA